MVRLKYTGNTNIAYEVYLTFMNRYLLAATTVLASRIWVLERYREEMHQIVYA